MLHPSTRLLKILVLFAVLEGTPLVGPLGGDLVGRAIELMAWLTLAWASAHRELPRHA